MVKPVVVIQGHPDPAGGHLCHALADAYVAGAAAAGHTVERVEVAQLDFPMLRSAVEFESGAVPPDIKAAQAAIMRADHLVLVYPLWLGTMPALFKAFLEQCFRPGFALDTDGMWDELLAGKSARVVVTMGMPAPFYRWYYGAHSLKSLERNILGFVGIAPIRESLFGGVEAVSDAKRAKWLKKMEALGRKGE
ncbi:MAG: NAD(P)H-dependent oxidoreductase [Alphaproteobacteria bacterium]|nr:NAD(P)H-dependent oxidoreductase [Alphaproteobacteria bacterium]